MSNELAQDDGLIQEFVTESEEQLQGVEKDLLSLETSRDAEMVNRLFRAMHTVKGTSSFLGFDLLVELSHHAEDLLNAIRRGEAPVTKAVTNVLLLVCDQIRRMLRDISEKRELQYDNQPLIEKLKVVRTVEEVPRLGEILSAQPVVHPDDLKTVLKEAQQSGEKLGEVLVERGLATPSQVEQALTKQGVTESVAERATMRVDVRKLDCLVDLVGELVLERNRLAQLSRDLSTKRIPVEQLDAALGLSTTRLSFITEELQSASLKTRMVPIETVFRRLPRMVREVSSALGKDVQLEILGQETEIDKTMVEVISDPLVHLVRNALDHGIESSGDRVSAGKCRQGKLTIEARAEGDQIVVLVKDDGRGIDPERISTKAVEKGFISADCARALTQKEALELIFMPGMSTAETVNNVSGRGVGMDVVRSNIKKLNGTVELESRAGLGTTVRMRVPLTMAILPVLMVEAGPEVYALPLRSVQETLRVSPSQIHLIKGREVLCLTSRSIPLLRLGSLLGTDGGNGEGKAVVIGVGDQRVALLVDKLIGQESTVIKAMNEFLKSSAIIAGATIGGDGRIRLVLDPAGLIDAAIAKEARQAS